MKQYSSSGVPCGIMPEEDRDWLIGEKMVGAYGEHTSWKPCKRQLKYERCFYYIMGSKIVSCSFLLVLQFPPVITVKKYGNTG